MTDWKNPNSPAWTDVPKLPKGGKANTVYGYVNNPNWVAPELATPDGHEPCGYWPAPETNKLNGAEIVAIEAQKYGRFVYALDVLDRILIFDAHTEKFVHYIPLESTNPWYTTHSNTTLPKMALDTGVIGSDERYLFVVTQYLAPPNSVFELTRIDTLSNKVEQRRILPLGPGAYITTCTGGKAHGGKFGCSVWAFKDNNVDIHQLLRISNLDLTVTWQIVGRAIAEAVPDFWIFWYEYPYSYDGYILYTEDGGSDAARPDPKLPNEWYQYKFKFVYLNDVGIAIFQSPWAFRTHRLYVVGDVKDIVRNSLYEYRFTNAQHPFIQGMGRVAMQVYLGYGPYMGISPKTHTIGAEGHVNIGYPVSKLHSGYITQDTAECVFHSSSYTIAVGSPEEYGHPLLANWGSYDYQGIWINTLANTKHVFFYHDRTHADPGLWLTFIRDDGEVNTYDIRQLKKSVYYISGAVWPFRTPEYTNGDHCASWPVDHPAVEYGPGTQGEWGPDFIAPEFNGVYIDSIDLRIQAFSTFISNGVVATVDRRPSLYVYTSARFKVAVLTGLVDVSTDEFRVCLLFDHILTWPEALTDPAGIFNLWSDISAYELPTGKGYTQGGKILTFSELARYDGTNEVVSFFDSCQWNVTGDYLAAKIVCVYHVPTGTIVTYWYNTGQEVLGGGAYTFNDFTITIKDASYQIS